MVRPLSLLGSVLASNFKRLALPYKLTLILTYQCNFTCKVCEAWKAEPKIEVSSEEVRIFFKKTRNFSWVNVSGGEIFTRADIEEIMFLIINESNDLQIFNFPTNGYFTEETLRLVQKMLNSCKARIGVTVSIDGSPGLHDEIRGVAGAWENAVRTYRALREIRHPRLIVKVGYTLQPQNINNFHQFYNDLRARIPEVEISDIHLNLYHYSPHYYMTKGGYELKKEILDSLMIINEHYSGIRIKNIFDFVEYIYRRNLNSFILKGISPFPCQALSASCFIDPLWNVYPCAIFDFPLGNLRDYGHELKGLWESIAVKKAITEINRGNCPQCWTPCEAYQSILAFLPYLKRKIKSYSCDGA